MNCDDARRLIAAYSDGELDLLRNLEVEEHLRSCDSCASARENLRALKQAAHSAYFRAPDGLGRAFLRHSVDLIPSSTASLRPAAIWVSGSPLV